MDIEIVTAQKHRDLKTGKINSTAIDLSHLVATPHSNTKENLRFHLFVIDDLCDGKLQQLLSYINCYKLKKMLTQI